MQRKPKGDYNDLATIAGYWDKFKLIASGPLMGGDLATAIPPPIVSVTADPVNEAKSLAVGAGRGSECSEASSGESSDPEKENGDLTDALAAAASEPLDDLLFLYLIPIDAKGKETGSMLHLSRAHVDGIPDCRKAAFSHGCRRSCGLRVMPCASREASVGNAGKQRRSPSKESVPS